MPPPAFQSPGEDSADFYSISENVGIAYDIFPNFD